MPADGRSVLVDDRAGRRAQVVQQEVVELELAEEADALFDGLLLVVVFFPPPPAFRGSVFDGWSENAPMCVPRGPQETAADRWDRTRRERERSRQGEGPRRNG